MKTTSAGLAALAFVIPAIAAHAADLPRRGPALAPAPAQSLYAPPAFTWTGFYAGLNAGYNWGTTSGAAGQAFSGPSGSVAGATVGYNYQIGQIVVGAEADWDIDGARSSRVFGAVNGVNSLSNVASLRARLGFAADRALVYATGGYAGGTLSGSLLDPAAVPTYYTTSAWRNGYSLGAGIEYAFTDKVSGKAEYIFNSLASQTVFAPPRLTTLGVNESTVRAGVNYHF